MECISQGLTGEEITSHLLACHQSCDARGTIPSSTLSYIYYTVVLHTAVMTVAEVDDGRKQGVCLCLPMQRAHISMMHAPVYGCRHGCWEVWLWMMEECVHVAVVMLLGGLSGSPEKGPCQHETFLSTCNCGYGSCCWEVDMQHITPQAKKFRGQLMCCALIMSCTNSSISKPPQLCSALGHCPHSIIIIIRFLNIKDKCRAR